MNDDDDLAQAMIANAIQFIIESIEGGSCESLDMAYYLDDESIDEFGDEYVFTVHAYHSACDMLRRIRAIKG